MPIDDGGWSDDAVSDELDHADGGAGGEDVAVGGAVDEPGAV